MNFAIHELLNPGRAQRYAYIMNALLFKINMLHSILAMAAKEKKNKGNMPFKSLGPHCISMSNNSASN